MLYSFYFSFSFPRSEYSIFAPCVIMMNSKWAKQVSYSRTFERFPYKFSFYIPFRFKYTSLNKRLKKRIVTPSLFFGCCKPGTGKFKRLISAYLDKRPCGHVRLRNTSHSFCPYIPSKQLEVRNIIAKTRDLHKSDSETRDMSFIPPEACVPITLIGVMRDSLAHNGLATTEPREEETGTFTFGRRCCSTCPYIYASRILKKLQG